MKQPDDSVFLHHILDAIEKIEEYLKDVTEEQFHINSLLQDGVIREIQIIGEAVRRISPLLKGKYESVPWQDISGMRSKLVHDYFGVDLNAVYKTAKEDIPPLKMQIQQILKELSNP